MYKKIYRYIITCVCTRARAFSYVRVNVPESMLISLNFNLNCIEYDAFLTLRIPTHFLDWFAFLQFTLYSLVYGLGWGWVKCFEIGWNLLQFTWSSLVYGLGWGWVKLVLCIHFPFLNEMNVLSKEMDVFVTNIRFGICTTLPDYVSERARESQREPEREAYWD